MRILIYGCGAVGVGIASCLLASGEEVDIIAREDTVASLRASGLCRTGIFGDFSAPAASYNCSVTLEELSRRAYDCILITTKSFDSRSAAEDISLHPFLMGAGTRIVLFQNGWGNADIFASFFPKERIFNARVITGFRRQDKNHVVITVHAEPIHIGSLFTDNDETIRRLCDSIRKGGIPCETVDDIGKDLWAKMLYNCALNPLSTLCDVPYGVLGEYEHSRLIMDRIVYEMFDVMRKHNYRTHWSDPAEYLKVFYKVFLPATADHESSMLQDLRAKKKTEIDALNGEVVRLAGVVRLGTPYNGFMYNAVKFIEARNLQTA